MDTNIVSAGVGLVGAIIGGVATYFSVNKQLKFERERISREENERLEIAIAIIKNFLLNEIKINYETLKMGDPSGELLKIYKREVENTTRGVGNFSFRFTDFDKVKYDLIKYNVRDVLDTIEIYQTFRFIQDNSIKRHFTLSENGKELIKKGIIKCEKMIRSF